jgi:hypothetical protein
MSFNSESGSEFQRVPYPELIFTKKIPVPVMVKIIKLLVIGPGSETSSSESGSDKKVLNLSGSESTTLVKTDLACRVFFCTGEQG